METIGTKISKIRKQKGLSQEELADLSKINLRTIQRIEKNENEPRGNTLKQICDVLEINIEELLTYGKIEDKNYIIFLHLSIITNIIIPLGNIIIPSLLWLNKRERIIDVNTQGKNILNFQIMYTLFSYLIVSVGAYCKITHIGTIGNYLLSIYISLAVSNFFFAIYTTLKINNNGIKNYYPNPIKFLK